MSAGGWFVSNIPSLTAVEAGAVATTSSSALSTTEVVVEAVVESSRGATATKVVVGATGAAAEVVTAAVPRHLAGSGLARCCGICGVIGQKLEGNSLPKAQNMNLRPLDGTWGPRKGLLNLQLEEIKSCWQQSLDNKSPD